MSTQELLTFLFNAIALSFITTASIDFGTRLVIAYKQVSIALDSPLTKIQQPSGQLPLTAKPEELGQLPDPWLLPLQDKGKIVPSTNLAQREQKHLRLLPPAKTINVSNLDLKDLLRGVDLDKLKLRQARKLAKTLGIAQKVNGRDQKLDFLRSQIKVKLQQETLLNTEVRELIREARLAS